MTGSAAAAGRSATADLSARIDIAARRAAEKWLTGDVMSSAGAAVVDVVGRALMEDLGGGRHPGVDVTTLATVPPRTRSSGDVVAKAPGVLAGVTVAAAVFDAVAAVAGRTAEVEVLRSDATSVRPGEPVLRVRGEVVDLLSAERTALNLLCQLSGTATLTARWVDALAGTGAQVRDTRKTVPGLRHLQKYAVRCGGGHNHRMALSDAALIKDNHVVAAGGVSAAYQAVIERFPDVAVEVECDTLEQVVEAVTAGAQLVLLDNMSTEQLSAAVRAARAAVPAAGEVRLEASGGLDLATARDVAATGVDFLAVGALTHSAPALDLGFELYPPEER